MSICQRWSIIITINPNNIQAFVPKKLKWNEIIQEGQWELKDLTHPKPIKPLTTPSKIIQHTNGTIQIEFSPTSRYSFNQDLMSARPSTSNASLNGVDFTPKFPIHVYQQQESPPVSPTYSDLKSILFIRKIIKRLILFLM